MQKIILSFKNKYKKMHNGCKNIIKWGLNLFIVFYIAGFICLVIENSLPGLQLNLMYAGRALTNGSMALLAEFVIGALIFDYVFNK